MGESSFMKDRLLSSEDGILLWNQEQAILEITELICEIMESEGVSRKELADRLHKTKGHVTQLLDGTKNMTIRTISDVFTVLGYEFHPVCIPMDDERCNHFVFDVQLKLDFPQIEYGYEQMKVEVRTKVATIS